MSLCIKCGTNPIVKWANCAECWDKLSKALAKGAEDMKKFADRYKDQIKQNIN